MDWARHKVEECERLMMRKKQIEKISLKGFIEEDFDKWKYLATIEEDSDAQWALGLYFQFGFGVAADMSKSFKWFSAAAEQGKPAVARTGRHW